MAANETVPHGLKQYTDGTDKFPGRLGYNEMIELLNRIPGCGVGPLSSRPLASSGLRFWVEEATGRLSVNLGDTWAGVAEIGGTTTNAVVVGNESSEGSSSRAARADHTHALPLATSTTAGALPATDKALLDTATSSPTGNAVVKRDAAGRTQFASPNVAADAATKGYVDSGLAGKSATTHSHVAATTSAPGFMSAADKAKLDIIPTIGTQFTTGILTPTADWEIVGQRATKYGPWVDVYISLKRVGLPIAAHVTGDIINTMIGVLHENFRPTNTGTQAALSTAGVGFTVSACAFTNGDLILSAIPPNTEFATGTLVSIQGAWISG